VFSRMIDCRPEIVTIYTGTLGTKTQFASATPEGLINSNKKW